MCDGQAPSGHVEDVVEDGGGSEGREIIAATETKSTTKLGSRTVQTFMIGLTHVAIGEGLEQVQ